MYKIYVFCVLSAFAFIANAQQTEAFTTKDAEVALNKSIAHCKEMMKTLPDTMFPRTINDKRFWRRNPKIKLASSPWWTAGFYPATLWYLYEYSGDDSIKQEAIKKLKPMEKEKYNTTNHDLGFMLYCPYGNALKIKPDSTYSNILVTGANSLSSRFYESVGCIRSWDWGRWQCPVIIDNMMNLEYLFWATRATGDSSYYKIAVSHADKTMQNHFRKDYSSYHVLSYDTITGEVISKETFQGYSNESAWARGQSWGLYGFTMVYRETKDERYLKFAQNIANYILDHPNLPEDKIPYWDFNAPNIPEALRDASAGTVIASALLELSEYVDEELATKYFNNAEIMLKTLSSDEYLAAPLTNHNFILKHSVGFLPHKSEVDTPQSYADYYFVEALLRYLKIKKS